MSDSIYAPPTADVEVSESAEQRFYVVALPKFVLLSVLTLELYFVYWFYRNWKLFKQSTSANVDGEARGVELWPVARGLFYIFFTHSLFRRVDERLQEQGVAHQWRPGSVATGFVVLTVLSLIASGPDTKPALALVLALVPVLTAILWQGQKAINVACGDEKGASNERLTWVNWIWMVLGSLIWLGGIAALFLPDVE